VTGGGRSEGWDYHWQMLDEGYLVDGTTARSRVIPGALAYVKHRLLRTLSEGDTVKSRCSRKPQVVRQMIQAATAGSGTFRYTRQTST